MQLLVLWGSRLASLIICADDLPCLSINLQKLSISRVAQIANYYGHGHGHGGDSKSQCCSAVQSYVGAMGTAAAQSHLLSPLRAQSAWHFYILIPLNLTSAVHTRPATHCSNTPDCNDEQSDQTLCTGWCIVIVASSKQLH